MSWYKNLRIRSKLFVGFGLTMLLSLIVAIVSILSIKSMDNSYTYVLDVTETDLKDLLELETHYTEIRRITTNMALNSGESAKINGSKADLDKAYDDFFEHLNAYIASNQNDSRQNPQVLAGNSEKARAINNTIQQYRTQISEPVLQYALSNNQAKTKETIALGSAIITQLNTQIEELRTEVAGISQATSNSMTAQANGTALTVSLLSAVIYLFSICIAAFVSMVITKPISRMVDVAASVAKGNLNVNLMEHSKDEIGVLSENFFTVINMFKSIVEDLDHMSAQHHLGNIDVYIEGEAYVGAYREMVISVNNMVRENIDADQRAMSTVNAIVGGDFAATMERLPGKKAFINEAIESLRASLLGINSEVDGMIKNSIAGKLSARIDVKKYSGDWVKLMTGLNDVLGAVASPIYESLSVLQEMARGNFDATMNGNYSGDFDVIKKSVNETVSNISVYINEISSVLNELANNNLDQTITREYVGKFSNIKDALNNIIEKLNTVMSDISSAANQVAAGAKQISESSMKLAQGATEQASSVQELNATVITVNDNTTQNAANAKEAKYLSDASKVNAGNGDNDMKELLASMDGIKESSNNISKIIKVIDDIAFQTNLLALNAAVEAARAGQYGKGFAVVAEEVRNLAGRSQNAAKETSAMIEESIERVNEGTKMAGTTADALKTIVSDAGKVADIIANIADASNGQAVAIGQITEGLSQVAGVVQNNSATSEEAASASQQLSSQADVMNHLVSIFKLK